MDCHVSLSHFVQIPKRPKCSAILQIRPQKVELSLNAHSHRTQSLPASFYKEKWQAIPAPLYDAPVELSPQTRRGRRETGREGEREFLSLTVRSMASSRQSSLNAALMTHPKARSNTINYRMRPPIKAPGPQHRPSPPPLLSPSISTWSHLPSLIPIW